jgi:ABC-type multidrug transport system fused ATPase/permease subunit
MPQLSMFKTIFKNHKWQLLLTYALFSLEMFGSLMRPYFLGKAVDGLIYGHNKGLYELIGVHLAYLVAGTLRHQFDTRTYTAIYTDLVTRLLNRKYSEKEVSKLSAHSNLAREFVDFLEFDLVYVVEAGYNIIGSLILLCFYDIKVVGICLFILLPVSALSYFYGKKMKRLNKSRNDELENQVDIIGSGNPLAIRRHYNNLRFWQIKISDQEAYNFGLMELMVIAVIGSSLYVTSWLTHTEEVPAGSLIGIYTYILKFVGGLDTIPYTVQRLTNLTDITRRMELGESDLEEIKPAENEEIE